VHHHRCNADALDVDEATRRAAATWGAREPYFHVSSPRAGADGVDLRPHADYVDPGDVPELWQTMRLTVDVEAKAKERAVIALKEALTSESAVVPGTP
jgi:UV DNA damage endonuclease